MTGPADDAAEIGRVVGAEMAVAAEQFRARLHRWSARMRVVDAVVLLLVLPTLACFGLWLPWLAGYFACSLVANMVMYRRTRPRRKATR